MKRFFLTLPLIFICGTAQSDAFTDQTKVVLGQLFIKETFSRMLEGKGLINPPVANLEETLTPSFITNPRKTCWVSPQYHSDATVTPRLVCH
jgi:hypothetical protein